VCEPCAGGEALQAPLQLFGSNCLLTLAVVRGQAASLASLHLKGTSVAVLPCFLLNGPEPMCTTIHNTLCNETMMSFKPCI
jgi:hypothetical protein